VSPRTPALVVLSLLSACSEYNLAEGKDAEPGAEDTAAEPGEPDLVADPAAVSQAGVCGDTSVPVTLTNRGDAPLTVTSASTSGSWAVSGFTPPITLDPGGDTQFTLTGQGEGSLEIGSDDPDEPVLVLPLETSGDDPPALALVEPGHGDILDPGDRTVEAAVSDTEDAFEDIALTWTSDVDGVIADGFADAAGTMAATWPAGRSEGDHVVTVTATDTCGNTASVDIGVCQQAGYSVDELDISSWNFEGSAAWDTSNNWLRLTPAATDQVGTAFATSSTVRADSVQISFAFFIGNGSGADGISLTALDTARMTTFLGGTGCGLGYGGDASCTAGPALPGWSIEVDTYHNEGQDPTAADHVMFTFDGDVDDPAVWAELPEMEDTGWHQMVVDVSAPHVTVSIDGTVYIDQDVSGGIFAFDAYVGFTAGTGGLTNEHLIDSLEVTEYVCSEE
jgi:hypothetical protein